MKEIIFRGKISGTDAWIFGLPYAVYSDNEVNSIQCIETKQVEYIKTETLGQFTGLTDKNGKKIFEGDILQYIEHEKYHMGSKQLNVWYNDESASFGYIVDHGEGNMSLHNFSDHDELQCDVLDHWEIIGNIHDNKKL